MFKANNVIPPEKHRFSPGRYTAELNFCWLSMNGQKQPDDGYSVDVLYFNFQKAFDSVPRNHLISKLQGSGIAGHVLEWIRNFLVGSCFE